MSRQELCCMVCCIVFFFNDTATTEIYTLSLHDALPIYAVAVGLDPAERTLHGAAGPARVVHQDQSSGAHQAGRSEEHTSELQSRQYLVCRLLLEKKKIISVLTYTCLNPYTHIPMHISVN